MALLTPCAFAQNDGNLNAGRKIQDGDVAHGVRGIQMYQRHAQDRSQFLHHQTQAAQPIQKAEAAPEEHAKQEKHDHALIGDFSSEM